MNLDGWGSCLRATPLGAQCASYEFVRFRGIIGHLEKISISKNRPVILCEPHFFGSKDRRGLNCGLAEVSQVVSIAAGRRQGKELQQLNDRCTLDNSAITLAPMHGATAADQSQYDHLCSPLKSVPLRTFEQFKRMHHKCSPPSRSRTAPEVPPSIAKLRKTNPLGSY
jgi:hypothetical protein